MAAVAAVAVTEAEDKKEHPCANAAYGCIFLTCLAGDRAASVLQLIPMRLKGEQKR